MKYQNPISKYKQKPLSLRCAVNAHCYICMGGAEADIKTKGSIISDIKGCASKVCPLLSVRPFTPPLVQGNNNEKGAEG